MDGFGSGPTLAVKDLIDVAGVPTTAGCRGVADYADPALADAPCLMGARMAGARIVGKTNLFELAYGASGVNEFYGTPVNPLDGRLVPGGSSSGSAVAVAAGDAEVAFGTDTGGSVRVPSAFCGTVGLKTTHGRVATTGVYPLAPSLDTVGPMASDVAGVALGMALLEPGFRPGPVAMRRYGRVRTEGIDVDPNIDNAVDRAVAAAELEVVHMSLTGLAKAHPASADLLDSEAAAVNAYLLRDPQRQARLSPLVASRLDEARALPPPRVRAARALQQRWRAELDEVFKRVEVLVLPTVGFFPPPLDQANQVRYTRLTAPFNLAGCPALAIPVPTGGHLPASLQLVGPPGSEETLVAAGAHIESAIS